ncbi:DUF493 family protein [Cellulophaga sp. E16_2]|uniref:DUF493 domain-containing protein n=1 Tax=Cellulophaga algicola (strain DSM 14237 / IC166 / ACAM 630) TaxID=688270 RepID=E6X646_CELAD|nr:MULTISPECIES: DUF493 family protein [Cellulophaga]ADV50605.1 hypothetical protein Celal_3339 [Cellulophaga algicola DSM 14237]MBO0592997.1 DUF493 family protein [Cellulophaga sp. E16_2]
MDLDKEKEFYDTLKERLEKTSTFPTTYLYKFIVPTEGTGVKEIESAFDDTNAIVINKLSKNGKFTSVSISLPLDSADAIIAYYKKVATVEGLISL